MTTNANFYNTLVSYMSTEKTLSDTDANRKFTFKVAPRSNKKLVKQAVEGIFNVTVTSVNIANVKPKVKFFRQNKGKISGWKKAVVTIAKDQDINFAEFE